jgi:hypothetical protein
MHGTGHRIPALLICRLALTTYFCMLAVTSPDWNRVQSGWGWVAWTACVTYLEHLGQRLTRQLVDVWHQVPQVYGNHRSTEPDGMLQQHMLRLRPLLGRTV